MTEQTKTEASFATVRVESFGLAPEELADRLTEAARRCADVLVYVEDYGRRTATDELSV